MKKKPTKKPIKPEAAQAHEAFQARLRVVLRDVFDYAAICGLGSFYDFATASGVGHQTIKKYWLVLQGKQEMLRGPYLGTIDKLSSMGLEVSITKPPAKARTKARTQTQIRLSS